MDDLKFKISNFASTELDLFGDNKKQVVKLVNSILKDEDLADDKDLADYAQGGNVVDKAHITILYGIKDESPKLVKEIANEYPIINVSLGKTNFFEGDFLNYDIVYLEVLSKELRGLRNNLIKEVIYNKSPFTYKPHISLFYVKKGMGKVYKGNDSLEGKRIQFKYLTFSPANGDDTRIKLNKS